MATVSAVDGTLRPPVITTHAPSIWAHTFSNFTNDDQVQQKHAEAIEAMKKEALGMLMAETTPLKQMMILIDTLERLGLAYHFETEIEQILGKIYNAEDDCDLFTTALRFRLLRQHQFHISCNVFDKFVDKDGKFEQTHRSDGEGLLSLYEAAHVRFHDEKILQEAAIFTSHYLRRMEAADLESPLKEKVKRALKHPLHRDVPIFHTRVFISIYEKDYSRDELLLKLAKFNFNFMQNFYKKELCELTRWWNKLDLKTKLPYTRDRLVEAYIWGIACHYEPQYSFVRTGVTKCLMIATIMDDTYDNYATLDEAQLFTEILDSWNMDGIHRLPNYLKIVYEFIMSTFQGYERDAVKQGKKFAVPHFKETVQQLGRAYNQELKWVTERKMPSFQDYAKNSYQPSCIILMFAASIPGLKSVTKETIDWMNSESKFVISTAMIGRYWNDIGSTERENKEGKMMTAVDCYMKQHGLSKQETLSKFSEFIEDRWMDVNEEWVATTCVPKETTVQLVNYARLSDACYNRNNGDGFTDPKIFAADVAALFLHPIPI